MDKKYFFFDIDGTLLPHSVTGDDSIPESTAGAIEQLKEKGNFCAIATGRAHCMAVEQAKQLGFDNMIGDGGHSIVLNGELVGEIEPLPRDLCIELAKECEEQGYAWAVSWQDELLRLTPYQEFIDIADDSYQSSKLDEGIKIEDFPCMLKMFVACKPGEEEKFPALKKLPWVRYNNRYIFVEPMEKERGIMRIRDYFGASDDDIVVFGDGRNDVSMFRPEWFGIAMGNAVPELKEKADFVTRASADDGIAYALKHFGWID